MCDFGIATAAITGAMALAQGAAGLQAGNANAALATAEGQAAERAARFGAARSATAAEYDLGKDRAAAAASGFGAGTATEALSSKATQYGLDIDAILYGGQVAKETSRTQAQMSRQAGVGALLGGVASAAGAALSIPGVWQTGGNPAVANPGTYGQLGRYGSSSPLKSASGRLIGGV